VVRWQKVRDPASAWLGHLLTRRPVNVATVALANKNARIAWALMIRDETFQAGYVAKARAACCTSGCHARRTGGSVTYSNNLEKIETIRDDGLIEGADPTIAALTGRIDVRFADTTLIDLAAGGTAVDLEFAYTLSAMSKLVLTAHEVYLPKPKLAVEGPGGVQASFDFRGAKNTGAGRMLTVTLTNDLDGSVYG
jgi:hypothetical protein